MYCHAPLTFISTIKDTLWHCQLKQEPYPDTQWALWHLWPTRLALSIVCTFVTSHIEA